MGRTYRQVICLCLLGDSTGCALRAECDRDCRQLQAIARPRSESRQPRNNRSGMGAPTEALRRNCPELSDLQHPLLSRPSMPGWIAALLSIRKRTGSTAIVAPTEIRLENSGAAQTIVSSFEDFKP